METNESEQNSSPQQPLSLGGSTRLPKRRRVALACNSCRHRKSRCDGIRPACSACTDLQISCIYEEPAASDKTAKRGPEQPTYTQLTERVKELEASLRLLSSAPVTTLQPSPATSTSDALIERVPVDDEIPVDALATNAFNDVPEHDIGHFGASSNHALFRALSSAFAYQLPLLFHSNQSSSEDSTRDQSFEPLPMSPDSAGGRGRTSGHLLHGLPGRTDPYLIPNDRELLALINEFFATSGLVLPYIDKSSLLLDGTQSSSRPLWQTSRPGRALLNIVCADAASTTRSPDAETFYFRSLALLDERTLRGSSLELVQALLLICRFQQNNQRSIASWTLHALAVKAALQLGLHSPATYDEHGAQKRELRKRVWFGVINQDRCLAICLGRPHLIPAAYVRVEPPQEHPAVPDSMKMMNRNYIKSLVYYNRLTSLHALKAAITESLYDDNIGSSKGIPLQDAVVRRLQLVCQLDQWRQSCSPTFELVSAAELETWSLSAYDANRFRILLSIHYYSTALLVNGPVLTSFLSEYYPQREFTKIAPPILDAKVLAIKDDFFAARELQQIVCKVVEFGGAFIDRNSAWWICNYHMLTVNLHLFGVLLVCQREDSMALQSVVSSAEVRTALEAGLKTLKAIERTSLMSRKGRHCLQRFLQVLDSLTSYQSLPAPMPLGTVTAAPAGTTQLDGYYSQLITESADDFMLHCSQLGFLDADLNL